MTPKVARYLRDVVPATPCLVLDVDRVEENYRRLMEALPLARVYYAVKAIPAGRLGTAEEFGAFAAFLCSVHAGFTTGQSILLDGGSYPGTL